MSYYEQLLAAESSPRELHARVIECFAAWLRISSDVSCETLVAHPFVGVAFGGMQASSPIFDACVDLVCELLYTAQDAERFAALAQVVIPRVMALRPFYAAVLADGESSENEARGFCRVFVELAETQMDFLASGTADSLQVAEVILVCTRHPNAEISKLTFNVWYNLKTRLTVAGADEAKRQYAPFFVQLVDALILLLHYPDTYDEETPDRQDDFKKFRKTVQDVVGDAVEIIGASASLERFAMSLQQEHAKLAQDPSQWQGVEAVLNGVRSVANRVRLPCALARRCLPQAELTTRPPTQIDPSERDVLPQILQLIPTLPAHRPLQYTATLTIGACADWLNGVPELLPALFPYLVNCLALPGVTDAAALSVKNGSPRRCLPAAGLLCRWRCRAPAAAV